MPRFHRFRVQHPDIDTAILSTYQLADLQAGEADLALRYGDGRWQGVEAEAILRFLVSPVCAPSLQQAIAGRPSAEALAAQTFIREDYDDWDLWLKEAGLAGFKQSRELRFVDYSMADRKSTRLNSSH